MTLLQERLLLYRSHLRYLACCWRCCCFPIAAGRRTFRSSFHSRTSVVLLYAASSCEQVPSGHVNCPTSHRENEQVLISNLARQLKIHNTKCLPRTARKQHRGKQTVVLRPTNHNRHLRRQRMSGFTRTVRNSTPIQSKASDMYVIGALSHPTTIYDNCRCAIAASGCRDNFDCGRVFA